MENQLDSGSHWARTKSINLNGNVLASIGVADVVVVAEFFLRSSRSAFRFSLAFRLWLVWYVNVCMKCMNYEKHCLTTDSNTFQFHVSNGILSLNSIPEGFWTQKKMCVSEADGVQFSAIIFAFVVKQSLQRPKHFQFYFFYVYADMLMCLMSL